MKILGIGLSGLIGTHVAQRLSNQYEFENCSTSTGIDITNEPQISEKILTSNASIIFHLAAKASVDGCEEDRMLGEHGEAWRINVLGTEYIAKACEKVGKKLIYLSTDFVFDGTKDEYYEEDTPHPVNWYGTTKYEAEKIVMRIPSSLILRTAYPYGSRGAKEDFVRSIRARLEKKEQLTMVTDHIMTPTYLDDIADAFSLVIEKEAAGIFHIVGSEFISPYDAGVAIAKRFGYDPSLIRETTRADFFKNRAERPFRLALKNDKITSLGARMKRFSEGLE